MSRKVARPDLLLCTEVVMDLQLKLFRLHSEGTYLFTIAQGIMDVEGIKALFHEIAKGTQSLLYCKVLVDLVDATMRLDVAAVADFLDSLEHNPWQSGNTVALIVSPHLPDLPTLVQLRAHFARCGLKIAVFTTAKAAIDWLDCQT
jgi:hypothetical protein